MPLRVAIVPEASDPAGAEGDAALGTEVVAGLGGGSEAATDVAGATETAGAADGDGLPQPTVASATKATATHRCRRPWSLMGHCAVSSSRWTFRGWESVPSYSKQSVSY